MNHTPTRTFHAFRLITDPTIDHWHIPSCVCDLWVDGAYEHDDDAHEAWLDHVGAVL